MCTKLFILIQISKGIVILMQFPLYVPSGNVLLYYDMPGMV